MEKPRRAPGEPMDSYRVRRDAYSAWLADQTARRTVVHTKEVIRPDPIIQHVPQIERVVETAVEAQIPEELMEMITGRLPYGQAQEELLRMYNELTNKVMMGLASDEERRKQIKLHAHLDWLRRGQVDVV